MSEVRPTHYDEIDLFELFKTLWDGKWKIIATTFVAVGIGVVFSVVKPNTFQVSTPIQIAKPSVFLPYTSLNNLLKKKGLYFDQRLNEKGFKFDDETIFNTLIVEFNDYEEMVKVLSEDEFVKQSIKDLDDKGKRKALIGFAKKFKIVPPPKNKKSWLLKFEWHDDYEGRMLFNNAIQKTLIKIQIVTKNNIDELAKAIDSQNSFLIENLRKDLIVIKQNAKAKIKKRLMFLKEQYAITTELGIDDVELASSALSQNLQNQTSFSIDPNDVPYYMRGSKLIKKEIELIESRSEKDILLMSDDYVELNGKITLLQNDMSSYQLKNMAKLIENDNVKDWVEFDMELADSKSKKKPMLYLVLSIVLGGMVGVTYVFISNAIRKNKRQLAKV